MALPASDSFTTGSAGTDLTDYSANWSAAFATAANQLELDGAGNARIATATVSCGNFWNADTFAAAHYAECIVDLHATDINDMVGPSVRHVSVDNHYGARASWIAIIVFEIVAGTLTQLGSSITVSWAAGDHTLRLSADGTTLTIDYDASQTTRSDATHATGSAGVCGARAGAAPGASLIRSWTADNTEAPPPPPTPALRGITASGLRRA